VRAYSRNDIGDTEFGEKEIQNNTRNSSKKYEIEKNKITGEIKKKYKVEKERRHSRHVTKLLCCPTHLGFPAVTGMSVKSFVLREKLKKTEKAKTVFFPFSPKHVLASKVF
jgi:hypothetical protein